MNKKEFADWEHKYLFDIKNLDIICGFVDKNEQIDFLHNLFDMLKTFEDKTYKQGFADGLNACKPNKKLDKAVKKGVVFK